MAKARQTVTKTELIASPIKVVTDIQVTTSDVMAIGMVEVETRLEERIKELATGLKEAEKLTGSLRERITNVKQNRVVEFFAQAKKTLEDAFKVALVKAKVTVYVGHGSSIAEDVETFSGVLQIELENCTRSVRTEEFVSNSEHVKLMKEYCQSNLDMVKVRDQLVEAKLNLSKLPSLERKYRAQLAKAQLNQSAEGRELLDQIQASTSQDLARLSLPALPSL